MKNSSKAHLKLGNQVSYKTTKAGGGNPQNWGRAGGGEGRGGEGRGGEGPCRGSGHKPTLLVKSLHTARGEEVNDEDGVPHKNTGDHFSKHASVSAFPIVRNERTCNMVKRGSKRKRGLSNEWFNDEDRVT